MHEVLTALAGQQQELTDLLTQCRSEDWARPSACDGWDVADVVLHMVQTNDLAIASALGTFGSMRAVRSPDVEGQTPTIDDLAALAVQFMLDGWKAALIEPLEQEAVDVMTI